MIIIIFLELPPNQLTEQTDLLKIDSNSSPDFRSFTKLQANDELMTPKENRFSSAKKFDFLENDRRAGAFFSNGIDKTKSVCFFIENNFMLPRRRIRENADIFRYIKPPNGKDENQIHMGHARKEKTYQEIRELSK